MARFCTLAYGFACYGIFLATFLYAIDREHGGDIEIACPPAGGPLVDFVLPLQREQDPLKIRLRPNALLAKQVAAAWSSPLFMC